VRRKSSAAKGSLPRPVDAEPAGGAQRERRERRGSRRRQGLQEVRVRRRLAGWRTVDEAAVLARIVDGRDEIVNTCGCISRMPATCALPAALPFDRYAQCRPIYKIYCLVLKWLSPFFKLYLIISII
jgi:hypothetical protein